MSDLCYVYGVTPADAPLTAAAPEGMDGAAVVLEREGDLAALVSMLPAKEYDAAALETRAADLDWLSPRAIAHDRVLSWASDRAAVAPLPMLTLFSDLAAVRAMLRDRRETLDAALRRAASGREYALRVYRLDAELLAHMAELSPRIGEMERSASASAPGQRYLLERKIAAERKAELRLVSGQVAGEVFFELSTYAVDAARSQIPATASEGTSGTMVLDAAFLVAPDRYDDFQRRLSAIVNDRTPQGFRFDFSGPWPAYHFVRRDGGHA